MALVVSIGAAAACGSAPATPGRADVALRGGAHDRPTPVDGTPRKNPAAPAEWTDASWLDADVAEVLAEDGAWDPGGCLESLRESAAKSVDGITAERPECLPLLGLACAAVPAQSCAPDECRQTDYECIPACNLTCTRCGVDCAKKADACKSACGGDADCRFVCGMECGACRQSCLTDLDFCTTAHCAEVSDECFAARDDAWNASACERVCPKVAACVDQCPEPAEGAPDRYRSPCAESCLKRFGTGCPARFDRLCAGDPDVSVSFELYRGGRAAPKSHGE